MPHVYQQVLLAAAATAAVAVLATFAPGFGRLFPVVGEVAAAVVAALTPGF